MGTEVGKPHIPVVDVLEGIGDGGRSRVDLEASASDSGCFAGVEPVTWGVGSSG